MKNFWPISKKWDNIEISDDEDDTHPNIHTPSLFKWRHDVSSSSIAKISIFKFCFTKSEDFLLIFDSDQLETNGKQHWLTHIRLPIRFFNTGSDRLRDRKLAIYES